jgi:hypothetical protein
LIPRFVACILGHAPPEVELMRRAPATLLASLLLAHPMAAPLAAQSLTAAVFVLPDSSLDASTAPPWNPPRPIPRRRMWEHALLLPGRIVTLPLSGLGALTERTLIGVEKHGTLQHLRAARSAEKTPTGVRVSGPSLGDRTGFGARIEAHAALLRGRLRTPLSVAQSSTIHDYQDTHVQIFGENHLEADQQWRPRDRFYGLGMGSSIDSLADYATLTRSARAVMRVRWNKEDTVEPRTEAAMWIGPRSMVTRRGREPGTASLEQRFPTLAAPLLDLHSEQLVYGARFASDWRTGSPHWFRGWRVLLESERYDKPVGWLAITTTRPGAQLTRTTVELEGTRSFGRDPRSLRLMGRIVDDGVTSGRDRMQLEDFARLGGREGLRGFPPGRFHDLDLVTAKLSYVFPLQRFFEMDLHVESGSVTPDLWRATRFDRLRQTAGLIVRSRSDAHPLASAGIEWSPEALRLVFTLTNPDNKR